MRAWWLWALGVALAAGGLVQVRYQGIAFSYDAALAAPAKATVVATQPLNPNTPPDDETAAHVLFEFPGYPSDAYAEVALRVFEVAQFDAAGFTPELQALQRLLAQKPNPAGREQLPFLPMANASMVLHARHTYLNFKSGQGLRYLTVFAQEVSPITEGRVLYVYQGLSRDGQRYVSAIFPVRTGFLPQEVAANFDYAAFEKNYPAHVQSLRQRLNNLPASSFKPALTTLDALVQSLEVQP